MAVEAFETTEQGDTYRGKPINDHGKQRVQYFDLPATVIVGDANTTIDLCELPFGEIRVIPELSSLKHSAFGAARTLDIGHREYQKRDDPAATLEPEDSDAFTPTAIDVSGAGEGIAFGTAIKYDMYSKAGVIVFATVLGGTIPVGATLSGRIAYVHE